MDELKTELAGLFYDRKVLTGLVDVILGSIGLYYTGKPIIENDDKIITYIETFYPDELNNRLEALRTLKNEEGGQ